MPSVAKQPEWRWLVAGLILSDVVSIVLAFAVAFYVRFIFDGWPVTLSDVLPEAPLYPQSVAAFVVVWIVLFAIAGLYSRENLVEGPREYALVIHGCTYGLVSTTLIAFFVVRDPWLSRTWLILGWLLSIAVVGITRFSIRRIVYYLRSRNRFVTRCLIVGANEQGKAIARQLTPTEVSGVDVVGFADDYLPPGTLVVGNLRVLAEPLQIAELAAELDIDELIVVPPAISWDALNYLVREAQAKDTPYTVRLSAGLYDVLGTGVRVSRRGYIPLLTIDKTRVTGVDALLKRVLDWTVAFALLVALAPVALFLAGLLKYATKGDVVVLKPRIGRLGVPYNQFRFAEDGLLVTPESPWLIKNLRRWLIAGGFVLWPSLINVLRRDMSLVGPRPISPDEVVTYGPWSANLLALRPGLTGPWWVGGDTKIALEQRVQLDLAYLRNYTIWLDLQVLFQTVRSLLDRLLADREDSGHLGTSESDTNPKPVQLARKTLS